ADSEPLIADGLGAMLLGALAERIETVGDGFATVGAVILALPDTVAGLIVEAGEPAARQRWLEIAAKLVLVIGAGLLAHWIVGRLLRRAERAIAGRSVDSVWIRLPMLLVRLVLALLPLAAFAAAA